MRTVTVVDLVFEDADCVCGVAVPDAVADSDWVLVIVDATTLAVGMRVMGIGFIFADVWEVGEVDEDEAFVAVEEDAEEEAMEEEMLWEEAMVDAAPVEVEMAEVEAKDEVWVVGEVSDAVDWEIMEVAIWESELAEGKVATFTTGRSTSERFFKKRFGPWPRRLKLSSCDWTSDGMVIKR